MGAREAHALIAHPSTTTRTRPWNEAMPCALHPACQPPSGVALFERGWLDLYCDGAGISSSPLIYQSGPDLAHSQRMVEEHGHDRTGAQQESPAEREAKKNPAEKQDLEKPSEGRDEPPAETVENGKRSPDSPWMGGG